MRKIVIDTDPGIDDAIALALALFDESVEVGLITTVAGNVNIEYVTENTLKLLKFYEKSVPVAKGASKPLIGESLDAGSVHGKTGLEGYQFPEVDEKFLLDGHAVNELHKYLMDNKDVTLVCLGPLTNIAILLHLYPEVKSNIREIVFMGGAIGQGNYGVYSEFNIGYDPYAAKMVFDSDIKKTMIPLEIGRKALIYPDDSLKIKEMNRVGDMFYNLFKRYRGGSFSTGLKMYDPSAVGYLLNPDLYKVEFTYVDVELSGTISLGATAVDLMGYLGKSPNMCVAIDIDANGFREWFLESIASITL